MQLKSFGCSFIWGSELPDEIPGKQHSNLTWPALMAQELRREYQCYAHGGTGNFAIAQQVLSQIEHARDALFVINWTWIDRFDYIDPANDRKWHTIRPAGSTEHSDYYYRNLHSQLQDKLLSLSQINLCLNLLEQHRIPYISTHMDSLLFETQWHTTASSYLMQRNIRPRQTEFHGQNFVQWAQAQNHSVTEAGHLLSSGHAAVAQDILDRLRINEIKTAC